jgi:hypothetical protein
MIFNPVVSSILKLADVQTSEVDAKCAPVSVGLWRAKFGNNGNHSILAWQLNHTCATMGPIVGPIF